MNKYLKDELHLHLYGCLTPKDIFELGKNRYQIRAPALEWFANEYEKHAGSRPRWADYWQQSSGIDLITRDFLATKSMSFPEFQARFNLMIALLPTTEHAITVLDQIVPEHVKQGIEYSEFRIFVPPLLDHGQLRSYFEMLADGCAKSNSDYRGSHISRVILSVSRNPKIFMQQYQVLKELQTTSKNAAVEITGLDFCGAEEGNPPEQLKQVFELIHDDNRKFPSHALAILYHVGESFDAMSIFSALRWIHESAQMGAHRLGHALAAGIGIGNAGRFADGQSFCEPIHEAQNILNFLKNTVRENNDLRDQALFLEQAFKDALVKTLGKDRLDFNWNAELRSAASAIQQWTLDQLAISSTIVETCPTSNKIIGRIDQQADLPVFQFSKKNVPFIVSSDDPGIFATTLAQEELICRSENRITSDQMLKVAENNQQFRAGILAGRESW
jgi:adenosine deaminase